MISMGWVLYRLNCPAVRSTGLYSAVQTCTFKGKTRPSPSIGAPKLAVAEASADDLAQGM
jgi:hypothetical protein